MSNKIEKYKPFDVADYLVDLDDIAGYLELAIQESAEIPPRSACSRGDRSHTEHERAGAPCGYEPRRAVQGAVRRWQSDVVDDPQGNHRAW